ncbi:MAG: hypothetical protein J7599_14560 [Niabella sp.]|nr:hypothetical protein [Niabella sp.]
MEQKSRPPGGESRLSVLRREAGPGKPALQALATGHTLALSIHRRHSACFPFSLPGGLPSKKAPVPLIASTFIGKVLSIITQKRNSNYGHQQVTQRLFFTWRMYVQKKNPARKKAAQ